MAYMNQEKKAVIAAALKKIMPKNWKYSLAVENHSTIVLTIASAPVDLLKICADAGYQSASAYGYVQINTHYMVENFKDSEVAELFGKIRDALYGADYYDDSDSQVDYFNTAYYVSMNVGKWNKAFQVAK